MIIPTLCTRSNDLLRHPFSLKSSFLQPFLSLHTRLLLPDAKSTNNSKPNLILSHPLLSLIERCTTMNQLKQIQSQMIITGLIADGFASSRLVAFCSLSRNLDHCRAILNTIEKPNLFTLNIAIRGYSSSHEPNQAILLYKQMLEEETVPDNYTFPFVLKACAQLLDSEAGKGIHGHVLKLGFDRDIFVCNALIHLNAICGELDVARKLFDKSICRDLVSWNSMINGYVRGGFLNEAIELFREMGLQNMKPDEVTMIAMVSASRQLGDLELGQSFHDFINKKGIRMTVPLTNALIDMYAKCCCLEVAQRLFNEMPKRTIISWTTMIASYARVGMMEQARELLDAMPEKDVVPWNAMLLGYSQGRREKEAFSLFHEMQASGVKPDEVTMATLLSACAQLGALEIGRWIHNYIDRNKMVYSVALGTSLVDMYAKCGSIKESICVFRKLPEKNALTWTAMIVGLATNGHGQEAISHFSMMVNLGLKPDDITFVGVLSACCHGGLVDSGHKYFKEMDSKYGLVPKLKHYSCMVDLLGRSGLLREAERFLENMPIKPDAVVLGALFFACRIHGSIEVGERIAKRLLELDPHDCGIYVLLSNMYAEANMWDCVTRVRRMMRERGIEKTPGCSLIEVNGNVHEFLVKDKSHPRAKEIYVCLNGLARQLRMAGYVPQTGFVN
ncbi:pentatricopeptide repeat-containing protein At2g22410, mitochondrial [Amborella trichopoda]|uniref:pentatricopeptide repeat-containing protein At2g22410, mitochondrial n=1 Tax=Amborella trichopoda TaxID=13333 RepID=UPI0005D31481|nr:pentatricopeptide repeat-containing protein At2g22410, mitochondrial [Amborella trichopoda]|eukprot:XP_011622619.1 pentatricopeptide repeat-containing protein At2g22410, mitochondrial [Amborella trichopoda]